MIKAFADPSFTWPFRVAIFFSAIPFLVLLGFGPFETVVLRSPKSIALALNAFFVACAVTALAQALALIMGAHQWIHRQEIRRN
jgi:hypothetical protein